MIQYLLQGFLFGIAYVAPIGTQNLYVINAATQKSIGRAFRVALITVFFDISLAVSCFFGVGVLVEKFLPVKAAILLLGSVIVVIIGVGLLRSRTQAVEEKTADDRLARVIFSCFTVTWLNPQALIDGSLLLGGFRASLPGELSGFFILGVCAASFLWFNTLCALVSLFKSRFAKAIRVINILCGVVLIFYGLKLAYSLFVLIRSLFA